MASAAATHEAPSAIPLSRPVEAALRGFEPSELVQAQVALCKEGMQKVRALRKLGDIDSENWSKHVVAAMAACRSDRALKRLPREARDTVIKHALLDAIETSSFETSEERALTGMAVASGIQSTIQILDASKDLIKQLAYAIRDTGCCRPSRTPGATLALVSSSTSALAPADDENASGAREMRRVISRQPRPSSSLAVMLHEAEERGRTQARSESRAAEMRQSQKEKRAAEETTRAAELVKANETLVEELRKKHAAELADLRAKLVEESEAARASAVAAAAAEERARATAERLETASQVAAGVVAARSSSASRSSSRGRDYNNTRQGHIDF